MSARSKPARTGPPAAPPRRRRGGLSPVVWVIAAALLMRLWLLLDVRDAPFWLTPTVDEIGFIQLAEMLRSGTPLPFGAYYVAPGYAYLLAGILAAGGEPIWAKYLQLAIGVLNAALVFLLGRRFFGYRAGVAAGLLWAVYPAALFHEVLLLKPTLTVCCSLVGLACVTRADGDTRPWRWLVAGMAFGAASLLRGEMVAVGLGLAAGDLLARRRGRPGAAGWPGPVLLVVGLVGVVAVPTVQNLRGCGNLVPVAYGGGTNFYIGNHDGADGSYLPLRHDRSDVLFEESDAIGLARRAKGGDLGPAGVSRHWYGEGLGWWVKQPAAAVALTVKKALLVWGRWEGYDVLSLPLAGRWVLPLRDPVLRPVLLLPLALVGLWVSRRRRELWPLRIFLLVSWLALSLFFLFERFRLPLTAVALVFTGYLLIAAWDAWRAGRRTSVLLGLAAVAAIAALLALPSVQRNEAVLHVNVGNMLLQQGRFEEALAEYRIVQRRSPSSGRVLINMANAQWALGRADEALASLDGALSFLRYEAQRRGRPSVEEMLYCHEMAGDIQAAAGRAGPAAEHYRAALVLAPEHPRLKGKLDRVGGGQ